MLDAFCPAFAPKNSLCEPLASCPELLPSHVSQSPEGGVANSQSAASANSIVSSAVLVLMFPPVVLKLVSLYKRGYYLPSVFGCVP